MQKLDLNPPRKTLRQFGFAALFGFGLIALLAWWQWQASVTLVLAFLVLGVLLAVEAALDLGFSILLRPVYVLMTLIAIPIGFVVTHVLLGLIYFVLFTAFGLFFRLRGKDPLDRAWDPHAKSYWHERKRQRTPASYLRLY